MVNFYFAKYRTVKFFVSFTLLVGLLGLFPDTVAAAPDVERNLGRGMDILSTFKDKHPQAGTLYDKLKERMPPGVRANEGKSDWLGNQAITSREQLRDKLNDKKTVIVRGGDGKLYGIPRKDLSGAIQSSIDHALAQPDFDKVYGDALARMTPEQRARLREKLGNKADILDSPATLRGLVGGLNGINAELPDFMRIDNPVGDVAMGVLRPSIQEHNNQLRDDLTSGRPIPGIDSPATAGNDPPKPEDKKPEGDKSGKDTDTAEAAKPEDDSANKARVDERQRQAKASATLTALFNGLDKLVAQLESSAQGDLAMCHKAINSSSRMQQLANEAKRRLSQFTVAQSVETIDHMPVYGRLKGILQAIKLTDENARDASEKACVAASEGATNASLSKEEALRGRNHAYLADQLKSTARNMADPLIKRLSEPIQMISREDFEAKRAEAYSPLKKYCEGLARDLKPYFDKVNKSGSLIAHWRKNGGTPQIMVAIYKIEQAINDYGGDIDVATKAFHQARIIGYKSRLQKLGTQAEQCTKNNAQLVMPTCAGKFNLTESGYRDTEQFTRARREIMERRKHKLAVVSDVLNEIERTAGGARGKADKARACHQQAEAKEKDNKQADACDGANKAIANARLKAAAGDFAGAQGDLNNPDIANCPTAQSNVADIQGQIDKQNDAGSVQQAQAALGACDVGTLNRAAGNLAGGKSEDAKNMRRELQDRARALSRIEGLINKANALRNSNKLGEARNALDLASQQLAALGGGGACAPLQTRIADINSAIINQATQNVAACTAAESKINNALQQYRQGQNSAARRLLEQARAELAGMPSGQCGNLVDRINNGVRVVERSAAAARAANAAIGSCNEQEIATWKARFEGSGHPAKGKMIARLNAAEKKCSKSRRRDEARQARDAANRECVKINGPGHYAGKKLASGNYNCLPTRRTANAWCNNNNPGAGWRATKIRSNGTYSCRRTRKANSQQAWSNCRRRFPNTLIDVKIYRSGKYRCITRTVRRDPRPQPQHDIASSAAIIGGIMGGFDRSNRGRVRPRRDERTQPKRPRRRCHHRRNTSRMHCGKS